jgi:hypothetical protein
MYALSVALLLFIVPALSVAAEWWLAGGALWLLIGKWFVFWAGGVRLLMGGIRQTARPAFTAEGIFGIKDPSAQGLVREIGFGNLSMGLLGLVTLLKPEWLVPAAIVSGLYYGLAGLGHAMRGGGNAHERIALWTDLYAFFLLAAVVMTRLM